jgi:hypothetical protein
MVSGFSSLYWPSPKTFRAEDRQKSYSDLLGFGRMGKGGWLDLARLAWTGLDWPGLNRICSRGELEY